MCSQFTFIWQSRLDGSFNWKLNLFDWIPILFCSIHRGIVRKWLSDIVRFTLGQSVRLTNSTSSYVDSTRHGGPRTSWRGMSMDRFHGNTCRGCSTEQNLRNSFMNQIFRWALFLLCLNLLNKCGAAPSPLPGTVETGACRALLNNIPVSQAASGEVRN